MTAPKKICATLVLATAAALAGTANASAATSLIAAYDKYVQGQGFDIGLVDLGTGAEIPVPAGVNTADDEIHPTLTADAKRLVFTRTQIRPLLNGDVIPPGDRTLMMVDRGTGAFSAPVPGEDLRAFGANLTPAPLNEDQLAFGLRPPFPRNAEPPSRIVTGAVRTSTSFIPLGRNHTTIGGPVENESSSSVLDVPEATIIKRADSRIHAYTQVRFNAATGGIQSTRTLFDLRSGISATPTSPLTVNSLQHPALRPPDGFVALATLSFGAVAAQIQTLNYPAQTTPESAPAAINAPGTNSLQSMPAWSPDGVRLAFVRRAASSDGTQRRLLVFDNTPGIQTVMNPAINLGTPAPTRQLTAFHDVWGNIALAVETRPDSTNVSCTSNCLTSLSTQRITSTVLSPTVQTTAIRPGSIGILLARVTGTRRSLGKRVPKLKPLGRVPLGSARDGRNKFRWNGRVGKRRLKPGTYVLTFRSLTPGGRVQAVSKTIRFRVDKRRRIVRPKALR
jgi:hypothetical protein